MTSQPTDQSWEATKAQQSRGIAYFLPRWYVLGGVWLWPLLVTLIMVVLIVPSIFALRFAVAWVALMVFLGVYVHILARRWPISRAQDDQKEAG
ncbi:MAG TPA: hypothetical protein VNI34_08335 [Candidatus Nitrosotalea sp.]|nr:hypothetical protein [Candidatus Nitrosotalea sp.]